MFLIGVLGISLVLTIVIYIWDKATTGGILNDTGEKKEVCESDQEIVNGKRNAVR
jgi:hypothetical protein